jgi:hypothetical protein
MGSKPHQNVGLWLATFVPCKSLLTVQATTGTQAIAGTPAIAGMPATAGTPTTARISTSGNQQRWKHL